MREAHESADRNDSFPGNGGLCDLSVARQCARTAKLHRALGDPVAGAGPPASTRRAETSTSGTQFQDKYSRRGRARTCPAGPSRMQLGYCGTQRCRVTARNETDDFGVSHTQTENLVPAAVMSSQILADQRQRSRIVDLS